MENQFPPNGHENAQQIFCQHLGRGNRWKRLLGKRRLARAHAGLIVASSGRSKSWLPWSVYKPLCDTSTILTIWILKYLPIIATLAGWFIHTNTKHSTASQRLVPGVASASPRSKPWEKGSNFQLASCFHVNMQDGIMRVRFLKVFILTIP